MLAIRYLTGFTAAGAAVAALVLAGCGGDKGSAKDGGGATLVAAKAKKVDGKVVTDRDGFVLYRFDADAAKPTKVTCYDACAKLWPPAKASGKVTVDGVDQSLVSTVKRRDGVTQLTLAGWPLYRYAKDDEAREAYGQGVGGTWFAVTPSGGKASGEGAGDSGY